MSELARVAQVPSGLIPMNGNPHSLAVIEVWLLGAAPANIGYPYWYPGEPLCNQEYSLSLKLKLYIQVTDAENAVQLYPLKVA